MARTKKRKRQSEQKDESTVKYNVSPEELPAGVHHYRAIGELPPDIQHYFRSRYRIWSKYDEGIWMTDDAWYGVTQELVATKIAEDLANMTPENRPILLDAFCGAGGNTIAFALSGRWRRVYAIEKDAATLECARRNAEIYGVKDRITWFLGDCFEILGTGKNAVEGLRELVSEYGVIFGSPPWGGPGYKINDVFDLDLMEPYTLKHLYNEFASITSFITLYLPRTSDLRQIADHVSDGEYASVVHYCTKGQSRALCVYFEFRGGTLH